MARNLFNSIKLTKPKKNVFDLTHDVKLSANMGNLTPILTLECVPGDKFDLSCESLIRFAPLVAPVMHRMDVTMHYFFVPNRILWDNWEKFITDANSEHVAPYITIREEFNVNAPDALKFLDYMGVPPIPSGNTTLQNVSALPMAAYQCIYNEYYRDQNLIAPINYKLVDGTQNSSWARINELCNLRKRAWEHDYFTASLPFAQKGAAVDIPIGLVEGDLPVYLNSSSGTTLNGSPASVNVGAQGGRTDVPVDSLYADTSNAEIEPTTINDLRRAFRLQEWLEKNARGGTRYIENILTKSLTSIKAIPFKNKIIQKI